MTLTAPRLTLAASVNWSGVGLHSGSPVSVTVHPAAGGLIFKAGSSPIEAVAKNVTDTRRCTTLGSISTVEHLMSALCALGVTDAEIEVEGGELPGLDGSALPYFEALNAVGLSTIGVIEVEGLFERVFAKSDSGAQVSLSVGDGHYRYQFDLERVGMGQQVAEVELATGLYGAEISPARTLVFDSEIELARQYGLGQGLDETSVLVIGQGDYLNEPRFDNEPARHKLLDLLGDLGLAGVPLALLNGVSLRSGHELNVRAAALLAERAVIHRS